MTLETITYTVGLSGIEPKTRQNGGVQGNHNVVGIEFKIDDELYSMLRAKEALWEGEKLYYHLERYNGEGNCEPTVPQLLVSNIVAYGLEEWITRYGGLIKVVLVLSFGSSEETQIELYHYDAILSLKSRPTGSGVSSGQYKSMATMSAAAINASQSAVEAAKTAEESAQIAKEHAEALTDAEVIFKSDLDDEGQPIPMELVVDAALSKTSTNPVQNKVVAEALEKVKTPVDDILSPTSNNPISNKAAADEFSKIGEKIQETAPVVGTDGIWTWRKTADGIAKCWTASAKTTWHYNSELGPEHAFIWLKGASEDAAGSLFFSNVFFDLPSGLFDSVTNVFACPSNDSGRWLCSQAGITEDNRVIISVLRNSKTDFNLGANISIKGTWKQEENDG